MSNHTTSPLFRSEVLSSLSQQSLGSVRLAHPISAWLISYIATAICVAFVTFVSIGSVSKKAHVTGLLMPKQGTLGIVAPNSGVLIYSHVHEGQKVKAGQTLFELSTERKNSYGDLTSLIEQQLSSRTQSLESEERLRTTQYQEKKSSFIQRLQNLDTESHQLEHELELAQRRIFLAQQSLTKYETLEASGYVSAAQTQQKQEDLLDIRTRSSSLERAKVQLLATRQQVAADLAAASTSLETDLSQLRRSQAIVRQEAVENGSRKAVFISAPHDGTITTISYATGQSISSGQTLAAFIPTQENGSDNADLEIHLYAPSRSAGFVAPGQPVLIRYQAFPYQKFGLQNGVITDVSKTPFSPNELPANMASTILSQSRQTGSNASGNEALYRIKVKPEKTTISVYGKAQSLKPGMTLEADIVQDKRKIWEWIAEPLLALSR